MIWGYYLVILYIKSLTVITNFAINPDVIIIEIPIDTTAILSTNSFKHLIELAYPNPTQDLWALELNQIDDYHIEMYLSVGKKIRIQKIVNISKVLLQINSLETGLYFINFINSNDENHVLKVMKD